MSKDHDMSELETSVGPGKNARPGHTPPDTSHLKDLLVPGEAEAEEASELADAAAGVRLPKTLKESLAMLSEVQGMSVRDKSDAAMKVAMLERLRAHIHALSQGPASKPITTLGHMALAAASSEHAEDIHLTLLRRTDAVVARRLDRDREEVQSLKSKVQSLEAQIEQLTAPKL